MNNIHIIPRKYGFFAVAVLAALIVIVIVLRNDNSAPALPASAPAPTASALLAPAAGLETPAVLPNAIIWHPALQPLLIYQPFDGRDPIHYDWIVGIPRSWQVFPAGTGDFHLVWITTEGELWRTLIGPQGEQLLAPIQVAPASILSFAAATFADGRTALVWQVSQQMRTPVSLLVIENRGRPLLNTTRLIADAAHVALVAGNGGQLQLLWVVQTTTGSYELHQASVLLDSTAPMLIEDTIIHTIETPPDVWLDSLNLYRRGDTFTALWSLVSINSPEQAHFSGLIWSTPADITPFTLELPGMALRWLGTVYDETPASGRIAVALNAFIDQQWQPVVLQLANGSVASYEIMAGLSANASAPGVWRDAHGYLTAAWLHLDTQAGISVQVFTTNPLLQQP